MHSVILFGKEIVYDLFLSVASRTRNKASVYNGCFFVLFLSVLGRGWVLAQVKAFRRLEIVCCNATKIMT